MKKNKTLPSLEDNATDQISLYTRMASGAFGPLGTLLSEVFLESLPNTLQKRLVTYVQILQERLTELEIKLDKHMLEDEEFIEVMRQGGLLATGATTKERKEYIANIIANGLSREDVQMIETKKILRTLDNVNDLEILLLCSYIDPTVNAINEFKDQHPELYEGMYITMASSTQEREKGAMRATYLENLCKENLLSKEYSTDITGNVEFDQVTKSQKVRNHILTVYGRLFLRRIGIQNERLNH